MEDSLPTYSSHISSRSGPSSWNSLGQPQPTRWQWDGRGGTAPAPTRASNGSRTSPSYAGQQEPHAEPQSVGIRRAMLQVQLIMHRVMHGLGARFASPQTPSHGSQRATLVKPGCAPYKAGHPPFSLSLPCSAGVHSYHSFACCHQRHCAPGAEVSPHRTDTLCTSSRSHSHVDRDQQPCWPNSGH